MLWTITSRNVLTLTEGKCLSDWSWLKPDAQIMYFSKSNLISSCAVCLWPPNYQNSVAAPCALTSRGTDSKKQSPQWHAEEMGSSFYRLFYDSSLSSQLNCAQTGSCVLTFLLPSFISSITAWNLPPASFTPFILLMLHSNLASLFLSFSFLSLSSSIPSFPPSSL